MNAESNVCFRDATDRFTEIEVPDCRERCNERLQSNWLSVGSDFGIQYVLWVYLDEGVDANLRHDCFFTHSVLVFSRLHPWDSRWQMDGSVHIEPGRCPNCCQDHRWCRWVWLRSSSSLRRARRWSSTMILWLERDRFCRESIVMLASMELIGKWYSLDALVSMACQVGTMSVDRRVELDGTEENSRVMNAGDEKKESQVSLLPMSVKWIRSERASCASIVRCTWHWNTPSSLLDTCTSDKLKWSK